MASPFTIGADPEIFITKGGKAVSAYGLVKGTKESPFKTDKGAYQVDGMALEFNIDPTPVKDFTTFDRTIVDTMATLKKAVPGYKFNISPVQDFDPEYFESQPPQAKELGCDPDYNAYTLEANPRPDGEKSFRTGAGHIHIGWGADIPVENSDHIQICADFVKMLDATVGMFMTFIDREPRRRELYGKAGAMRVKTYGVEYRTPSNAWIVSKDRRLLVHNLVNAAIYYHRGSIPSPDVCGLFSKERIVEIINTGDFAAAKKAVNYISRGYFAEGARRAWDRVVTQVEKGCLEDDQ